MLDILICCGDNAGMNYPGGKRGVYHKLINLMPPHEVYIEIHLGDRAFLHNFQFTRKELIYCDPPYLREKRRKRVRLYKYEYTKDQPINFFNSHHLA